MNNNESTKQRILMLPLIAHDYVTCAECRRHSYISAERIPCIVPPKTTIAFIGQSQDGGNIVQVCIDAPDAIGLYVTDLRIGMISQFSSVGDVAVSLFAKKDNQPKFNTNTVQIGQSVILMVANRTNNALQCETAVMMQFVQHEQYR